MFHNPTPSGKNYFIGKLKYVEEIKGEDKDDKTKLSPDQLKEIKQSPIIKKRVSLIDSQGIKFVPNPNYSNDNKVEQNAEGYVNILSSPRISIKLKNVVGRFSSSYINRLEIDHIENLIENTAIVPDFGFNPCVKIAKDETGWGRVSEIMNNIGKYERVQNYVEAKQFKSHERKLRNEKSLKLKII